MFPGKPAVHDPSRVPHPRESWTHWRHLRRAAQVVFLLFFVYVVLGARGVPDVSGWKLTGRVPPEVVFLADPLTWISSTLASRSFIVRSAWLILLFAALTAMLGRVFCGWVCPLGTLIDLTGRLISPRRPRRRNRVSRPYAPTSRTKYHVLVAIAVMAVLGVNAAGWVDPLAILMRGTTFALAPAGEWTLDVAADRAMSVPGLARAAYPASQWLRDYVVSPVQQGYGQGILHAGILLAVLALCLLRRRYWCNRLCPLGAFYGLLGRLSPLGRRVTADNCADCGICGAACRMEAIAENAPGVTDPSECLRCMECSACCPRAAIEWGITPSLRKQEQAPPVDLTRRGLLGAVLTGVVAMPLVRLLPSGNAGRLASGTLAGKDRHLLRPPGARSEPDFLRLCIRCGECFKVCPRNAIHPALLEAGLEGLWTPTVRPRLGYCEPACTLCTVTCPTTALRPLTETTKRTQGRLGIAVIDRPPCLPWGQGTECGVCEELCPVYPKAIVFRPATVTNRSGKSLQLRAPFVVPDKCTGCGICENKCPVEGESAIRVERPA